MLLITLNWNTYPLFQFIHEHLLFAKHQLVTQQLIKQDHFFFILLERNPFSRFKTINIVLLQFMKQTTNTLIMKQSVLMTSSSNILQASTKQVVMNNGLYYARVIVQCFNSNVTPGLPNTTKSTYIRFTIQKQFLRSNNMLLTWRQKEVLWIKNDRLKHVCIE